jgi:VacB/RNase II family 3'-5' exoribonuclease
MATTVEQQQPPQEEVKAERKKSSWRNRYADYYSQEQVETGLADGTLFEGLLRINAYNRKEAYVTINYQNTIRDVFVNGEVARNRALDCDRVIVKIEQKKKYNASQNAQDEEPKPVKNLLDGKVVALSQLGRRTDYVGFIKSTKESGVILPTDKYVTFLPLEKRMPRMLLPMEQCIDYIEQESSMMYVARVQTWRAASNFPNGQLVRPLGKVGVPEADIMASLVENGFDLSILTYPNIPHQFAHWTIPQDEIAKRKDLRQERVFSVDPESAKDLDDAISIQQVGEKYRIGVHIADVSYFVTPGSDLDQEAAARTTSIYLPQGRVLPMLPSILSDDLCSLHQGVDRLTFSIFFDLDESGNLNLESSELVKTVIRSQARFTYEQAQNIIDGEQQHELAQDLQDLNRITQNRRSNRLCGDDMISKLSRRQRGQTVSVDEDKLDEDCAVHSSSHELIEELMLLANFIAATKMIESNLKQEAVLRMHPKPSERRLAEFVELFGSRFDKADESSQMLDFMRHELNRCTSLAKYVLAGDCSDWSHYGLHLPHYTHFSSPIRRYSDLMVHRLLNQIIGYQEMSATSGNKVIVDRCNAKRVGAKRAEEQSTMALIRAKIANQPLAADAVVARVNQKSLQVFVPQLGEMVRINLEDLQVKFDKKEKIITLPDNETQIKQFDLLSVELYIRDGTSPIPEVVARIKN